MSSARKRSSSGPEPVARKPKHGINAAPQTLVSEELMDSPDPNEADSAAEILTTFEENIPETAPDPADLAAQLDRSSPSTHSNSPSDAAQSTDAPPTDPSPRPEESESPLPPSADRLERQRWDDKVFGVQDCLGEPWHELQQHIHICVVDTFPSRCPWTLLSDDTKARFMALCPDAERFIQSSGIRTFFEAWLWHILYDNLFSLHCTDKWTGSWAFFSALQRSLRGGIQAADDPYTMAYHTSRHLLARQLYMRYGPHTYPDRLVQILQAAISPLTRLRQHPDCQLETAEGEADGNDNHVDATSTAIEDSLKADDILLNMAEAAIRIDLAMIASKWNISMHMGDPVIGKRFGFLYDPISMDATDGGLREWYTKLSGRCPVDYVVSPLVQTFGDHYPSSETCSIFRQHVSPLVREYDTRTSMLQMTVVVNSEVPGAVESETEKDYYDHQADSKLYDTLLELGKQKAMASEKAAES